MPTNNLNLADGPEWIGTSAKEYLKLLILQKRDECMQEIRNHYYKTARGLTPGVHRVKARVLCLYLEVYSSLKRSYKETDFKKLSLMVNSNSIGQLTNAFLIMSDFLDQKRLTRFDSKINLDMNDPEGENLAFGL